jgi:hypothetical protein
MITQKEENSGAEGTRRFSTNIWIASFFRTSRILKSEIGKTA